MLTLSKHRVGRVQIALRRGADVGNFAKIDEHSCFFSAKRCERTRTTKKHRKLPPKSPPGCPRGAPGRPRAAPGPPRGSPGGCLGAPRERPGALRGRQDRPKSAPGAPRPPQERFLVDFGTPFHNFSAKTRFSRGGCASGDGRRCTPSTRKPGFCRKVVEGCAKINLKSLDFEVRNDGFT